MRLSINLSGNNIFDNECPPVKNGGHFFLVFILGLFVFTFVKNNQVTYNEKIAASANGVIHICSGNGKKPALLE